MKSLVNAERWKEPVCCMVGLRVNEKSTLTFCKPFPEALPQKVSQIPKRDSANNSGQHVTLAMKSH